MLQENKRAKKVAGPKVPNGERPELWIEWTPLAEVAKWPRNPKAHDDEGLKASYRRHGMVELPARDERSGRLVAGNGRIEALEQMRQDKEPPPRRVRVSDDGSWQIPILRGASFRNEAEAEAYLIGSNHLVESGGWDQGDLAAMLKSISVADASLLAVTGYSKNEVDDILKSIDRAAGTGANTVKGAPSMTLHFSSEEKRDAVKRAIAAATKKSRETPSGDVLAKLLKIR